MLGGNIGLRPLFDSNIFRIHFIKESTAVEIQSLETGKEMWDTLCDKHEKRALMVIVDLQGRIYALKRLDEGNMKTHMDVDVLNETANRRFG